ncbi:aminodeoxychorismate synthase component I [Pseudovibrio denitrificans]|uniref:aminodeoxychorismate synthase component I n=1 Tax=Pseudovibrio denitrificans TaxID=258256 RepID=UPI0039BF5236
MKTLIIDNYDSFTHNLVHLVASVNQEEPLIFRNDELSIKEVSELRIDNVLLSPGPGNPNRITDFGVCEQIIQILNKPILGVCLGHQGIAAGFGGNVIRAPKPIHGKASQVFHTTEGILKGLPSPFQAGRYHSLTVQRPLPQELLEVAWTDDGIVMGLMHKTRPIWGLQFHPESIISEHGVSILQNFRDLTVHNAPRPVQGRDFGSSSVRSKSGALTLTWKEMEAPPDVDLAFKQIFASKKNCFWLDSSSSNPVGTQWSYFGASSEDGHVLETYDSIKRVTSRYDSNGYTEFETSILDKMKDQIGLSIINPPPCPFVGGWVGYLGYELGRDFGGATNKTSTLPDVTLLPVDRFVAFDHQTRKMYLVCLCEQADAFEADQWIAEMLEALGRIDDTLEQPPSFGCSTQPIKFRLDRDKKRYLADVKQCLDWINAGETYQVCLTNTIRTVVDIDAFDLYLTLRSINPAPFSSYLSWVGGKLLSASPERFLSVNNQGMVEAKPIKGTIRRAANRTSDALLANELADSTKDRAENVMIVDLLRNDLSRVCVPGSVVVPKLCDIESFATVHQMVSTVHGQLKKGMTVVDLVAASFPGGSMTGAPKTRTLELIDRLEQNARGAYAGAMGWFGFDGAADLSIVIRTIMQSGSELSFGVGGGIVAQSTPDGEFEEMLLKAEASIKSIVTARFGSYSQEYYEVDGA